MSEVVCHAMRMRQNQKHCKSSIANKINAITLHNEQVLDGLLVGAFNSKVFADMKLKLTSLVEISLYKFGDCLIIYNGLVLRKVLGNLSN